jgi:hypothetical protein
MNQDVCRRLRSLRFGTRLFSLIGSAFTHTIRILDTIGLIGGRGGGLLNGSLVQLNEAPYTGTAKLVDGRIDSVLNEVDGALYGSVDHHADGLTSRAQSSGEGSECGHTGQQHQQQRVIHSDATGADLD